MRNAGREPDDRGVARDILDEALGAGERHPKTFTDRRRVVVERQDDDPYDSHRLRLTLTDDAHLYRRADARMCCLQALAADRNLLGALRRAAFEDRRVAVFL